MSQGNLTRAEAERRAAILRVGSYAVVYDFTIGSERFGTTTTVRFGCAEVGANSFLDLLSAEITSITLNGRSLEPAEVYRDGRIHLDDLAASNEVIVVATAPYRTSIEGMNRFIDPADGEAYVFSKFEPAHARRAYACFEQPDLKATWQVDVIAPGHWEVVSNMPTPVPELVGDGAARWSFAPTPLLPTYLTAVIAGPFHIVRDEHRQIGPDGSETVIPLALGCRRSVAPHLDPDEWFQITKDGLDFYVTRFGHPYPFPKYDQMLVPEYGGAMEQPGAVIFGDSGFLFRSTPTEADRELRAFVILHEMAHMWFGDLVTMRWWDDLWLNESFAEYAGALAVAESSQFTTVWASYASRYKKNAARADQMPTTHPIVGNIDDLDAVDGAFDQITYEKGASVLKQLAAWVGPEAFAAGVRDHFRAHAWANATAADFLAALGAASGRDTAAWARQWLQTTGVNTMRADFEVDRDGVFTSFAVRQEAPPDHPTLRAHRMAIGAYRWDGDHSLIRTDQVVIDLAGARTAVPELVGTTRPALLLLNDDDLTYTKIRLDPDSLALAISDVGAIDDPLARALVWSAAWDMCRDGEMAARDYVEMVLRGIDQEALTSTVSALLEQCASAISAYADPAWAPIGRAQIAARARIRLADLPVGSDRKIIWIRALANIARGSEDLDYLAGLLDGTIAIDGLRLEGDLRWSVVTGLAASGRIGLDRIDAELANDDTASGAQFAAAARAAVPDPAAKAAAWDFLVRTTSFGVTQIYTAYGFTWDGQGDLRAPYVSAYFQQAQQFLDRSDRIGRAVVTILYPDDDISPAALDQADTELKRDDLSPVFRRIILEGRDSIARSIRARATDSARALRPEG
jgi:aminopeptidase N